MSDSKEPIRVVIGTSCEHAHLAAHIADMVNDAYGHYRLSTGEVAHRLACGELRNANRVLHLAFCGDTLVGCMSSTIQPGFTPYGCGHWGLLAVDKAVQGTGVASALVAAGEQRLRQAGCQRVQIEYEYSHGHAFSDRLRDWYEGKLGFKNTGFWVTNRLIGLLIGHRPSTEFRRCRKELVSAAQ
mmetsp:Transcript_26120/g.54858  ORF Transcript_26120/g.54858 Transcript_26120/m.54858 type:complete len:185 (+) Transcript_26120:227-781(+)|eukprot:6187880-Pleurochrysis_carterae.AAC.2